MENVKFVRSEGNGDEINLYFEIYEGIADYIRENTNYPERALGLYLDNDNLFCYTITRSENFEDILQSLIETIEKISNEDDDVHFCNRLITNNGRHRSPGEIHALMHTEYGLAGIDEVDDADSDEFDIEWWTAHFFIAFDRLLFDGAVEVHGIDDEASDSAKADMIHTAASRSEIALFLNMLKSIDKVVIVDDVRKYGPEEIKKLAEESNQDDEETDEED